MDATLSLLQTLPKGNSVCHGDFHPGNILLVDAAPMIIDWHDATCGNPLADLARSILLLKTAALPDGVPKFVHLIRQWFCRSYSKKYNQFRHVDQKEVDAWRIVNAAARLEENVPEETLLLDIIYQNFNVVR